MNSLFLAGLGVGAFVSSAAFIIIMFTLVKSTNKTKDKYLEFHQKNLDALKERNAIDEEISGSLHTIAIYFGNKKG